MRTPLNPSRLRIPRRVPRSSAAWAGNSRFVFLSAAQDCFWRIAIQPLFCDYAHSPCQTGELQSLNMKVVVAEKISSSAVDLLRAETRWSVITEIGRAHV